MTRISTPKKAIQASISAINWAATTSSSFPSDPTGHSSTRAEPGPGCWTATRSRATSPSPPADGLLPRSPAHRSEIAAGANSLRPNRVPGQPISGNGSLKSWFNTAAFAGLCPTGSSTTTGGTTSSSPYCVQPGTYGSASRNSIELPGTVAVNTVLSRSFALGETRNLEARMQINNVFNTVQYSNIDTTLNSENLSAR